MEIISTQKFVRMSPQKLRLVASLVKKLNPEKTLEILPNLGKRAALPILKVIKSCLATAKNKGLSNLIFKEIQIMEGPRLKRGNPVSRGRWHPILKRMSHIRVVLQTTKSEALNSKLETKSKDKDLNVKKKGDKWDKK